MGDRILAIHKSKLGKFTCRTKIETSSGALGRWCMCGILLGCTTIGRGQKAFCAWSVAVLILRSPNNRGNQNDGDFEQYIIVSAI